MAGIGIQLNKIFNKHTVTASLYGIGFSIMYTIAPMLMVVICLFGMYKVLGFDIIAYQERELFSVSMLYIFAFSLLTSSPFNTVLSKYLSDKIFEQRYEDIRPCIYVGTVSNLSLSSIAAIPFYIREILIGDVPVYYVFTTYMVYLGLVLTLSTMVYNSILKQYKKISLFFAIAMALSLLLAIVFRYILHYSVTYSMLLALAIGFLLIGSLELANVLKYFPGNSHNYQAVLRYYRLHWKLIASNTLYTLGLFGHNFVFWAHPMHMVIRGVYVCNQPYDTATCIAMLTNLSANVLFISRVEMHFHSRYKEYTDCVIGGKLDSIEKAKLRMFRGLSNQILSLVQMQFIVSVVIYLLAIVVLPLIGFSGMIMEIYPMLAVGFFLSYLMYAELLFLYYYEDLTGAFINSLIYAAGSILGSILVSQLPVMWYGAGFAAGAFLAFTYSYFRLSWIEKNFDMFTFCKGTLLKQVRQKMPDSKVYSK
jgi:uncharacterized membrane protein